MIPRESQSTRPGRSRNELKALLDSSLSSVFDCRPRASRHLSIPQKLETYQILFHGSGFNVALDGDEGGIAGFYTARRVRAESSDAAFLLALENLKSEEKTKSLISESISNGGHPRFEAEEIFEVPFWSRLFGSCPQGFIFYDDAEEADGDDSESREELGDDANQVPKR